MDNTEVITVLSLCAGYGGLEFGLSLALENPLRVVAVEVEAFALANLVTKTEAGKLAIEALWPDLRTFPAARFRGCFDFIIAGYPCQPFSVAGKREGTADPRHLWPHIARIVQAVEPIWCFFENVPGHLTLGFPSVYRSLRDMGYSVEAGLFTAAEVGAPHRRERLFILGKSDKYGFGGYSESAQAKSFRGTKTTPLPNSQLADTERAMCKLAWRTRRRGQGFTDNRWPARPGEAQYEWEEPRVVDYPVQRRHEFAEEPIQTGRDGIKQTGKGQTQSCVGGAASRIANRVDRLRLLGNGVVPQQAEKAFRYLMEKQGR